ncbi:chemotaxis protein CheA [Endozoicomonas sp. 4G]|uniref:chemotaxis protein CheA n=1 Tax=Endozoicomonas sp. 4G TaxID=2872754 RepID=UPI00207859CD|nr:chemotaxis protein CheA [Endozoicomonas sp. 4G]
MAEQQDYAGLHRVKEEIEQALVEARQALEKYQQEPGNPAHISVGQRAFRQAHGALKLLQYEGASHLSLEINRLSEALISDRVSDVRMALAVLIQGTLQLSDYIQQTLDSGVDRPLALLPLINELRRLREDDPLPEATFFFPDRCSLIDPVEPPQLEALEQTGLVPLLRKIRQKYQLTLAGYLRDQNRAQQIKILAKLFTKLQDLSWGAPLSPLWEASIALVEGLDNQSIEQNIHVANLLRGLDGQIRLFIKQGAAFINTDPNDALLRGLLYYIATSKGHEGFTGALKARYNLEEALTRAQADISDVIQASVTLTNRQVEVNPYDVVQFKFTSSSSLEAETPAEVIPYSEPGQTGTLAPDVEEDPVERESIIDDELLVVFMEEADRVQRQLTENVAVWIDHQDDHNRLKDIRRAFYLLKGSGRLVDANVVAELAWSIENMLNHLIDGTIHHSPELSHLISRVNDMLPALISDFAEQSQVLTHDVLVCMEQADALAKGETYTIEDEESTIDGAIANDSEIDLERLDDAEPIAAQLAIVEALSKPAAEPEYDTPPPNIEQHQAPSTSKKYSTGQDNHLFAYSDLDLLLDADKYLSTWRNALPGEELKRFQKELAILAEQASRAGLTSLAELCDVLLDVMNYLGKHETLLPGVLAAPLSNGFEAMVDMMNMAAAQQTPVRPQSVFTELRESLEALLIAEPVRTEPVLEQEPIAADTVPLLNIATNEEDSGPELPELFLDLPDYLSQPKKEPLEQPAPETTRFETPVTTSTVGVLSGNHEMIRIPAQLLESLITLSSESSIYRGRVEQQVHGINNTLKEMGSTINLKDLDLKDLKAGIQEKSREAETLLLQQARTLRELQEKLMQARMVSFSCLLPRLRKITRQLSTELSKPVSLNVTNAEGKMDRTMLERILAPLEHLLRNAIDHGIESSVEKRLSLGKPETGHLTLAIARDGADVVVELSDDGQGIDLPAVHARALENNLISSEDELSDQEIAQLILEPGFSLDVVNTEIRQMGGSVQISSEPGKGASFKLRLPFTLSVNRALMVQVAGNLYALPMQSIDGITVVAPEVLTDCYQNNTPLQYGGMEHQLMFLGELLGNNSPGIQPEKCPVVIIQRGGRNLALHVDEIIGGTEIFAKSLGPQFADLVGVNGATILGDGRVAIIIDPVTLVRRLKTIEELRYDGGS